MSKANLSRLRSDPVRIAAFCFKNLKRTEVLDTDISSAVGKSSLSLFPFLTWDLEETVDKVFFLLWKIQNFSWFVSLLTGGLESSCFSAIGVFFMQKNGDGGRVCLCLFVLFYVCEWFGKLVGKGAVLAGVSCKTADLALLASEN